jgi:hypothetical protein
VAKLTGVSNVNEIFAQGDLLIERVADRAPSGSEISRSGDGALVLAEGEATGHRHAIFESVTMFRDDGLARDIPDGLYIGHVKVAGDDAVVQHDEHASITLPKGTWRIRRQRQLEPRDVRVVAD